MTTDETDDLAALWGAASPPEEKREFERLARQIPRRAQLDHWGELGLVAMLAVAISLAALWRGGSGTILTGGLILLLLGWSARKRHQLGKIALLIDESDRLSYVRSLLRAKEAELKRSRLGLALVPPGFLLTILLGYFLREPAGEESFLAYMAAVLSTPRGLFLLAFLAGAVALLVRAHLRLAAEVARVRALQGDYMEEGRWENE